MKDETLDNNFRVMVKLEHSNSDGLVKCYYCNGLIKWNLSVLAHYHKRGHKGTRWSVFNCYPAHADCNNEDERSGDKQNFKKNIIKDHGKGIIKELEDGKNANTKFTSYEKEEMNRYFLMRIKELKKFKRL